MLAILQDGIHCYFDNLYASGGKKKRLFEDAEAWIVASDDDWVFSFESVCDALGLNSEYVRQGLLRCEKRAAIRAAAATAKRPPSWRDKENEVRIGEEVHMAHG